MTRVIGGRCSKSEGCSEAYHARGLCVKHYSERRRREQRGGQAPRLAPCEVPPVCVCDEPLPDVIGECALCLRPFTPFFAEQRAGWRKRLGLSSVDVVAVPPPATSTDFAAPAANEGASLAPGSLDFSP